MASSGIINQFNEQWRQSPLYQQGLQAVGEPTNGPITLNGNQRDALKQWMLQHGVQLPQGSTIDGAGNANEPEGFGHQLKKWGPLAGGLALTAFGIPGTSFGGLFGGGANAATGAASGATQFGGANVGAGLFGSGATAGANSALGTASGLFGAGAGAGSGMAGGFTGFLSGLGKQLGGDLVQRGLGALGSGLSGSAASSAHNRGVALDAEQQAALIRQQQQDDFERQLMARAQEDRTSLNNAFTNSVQANRVLNSTGYKPATLSMVPGAAPSQLPNFGTGFAAPTAQQRGDAQALYDQASARLGQRSALPPLQAPNYFQNDPNLMKAGAGEKIGSWLGPALSAAGALRNPYQPTAPQQPQQPSTQKPKEERQ